MHYRNSKQIQLSRQNRCRTLPPEDHRESWRRFQHDSVYAVRLSALSPYTLFPSMRWGMCSFPEKTSLGYVSIFSNRFSERDNWNCVSHLQKDNSCSFCVFCRYFTPKLLLSMNQIMLCTAGESTTIWLVDTAFHSLRTLPIPENPSTAINWNHNSIPCWWCLKADNYILLCSDRGEIYLQSAKKETVMSTVNQIGSEAPRKFLLLLLNVEKVTWGFVLSGSRLVATGDEDGNIRVIHGFFFDFIGMARFEGGIWIPHHQWKNSRVFYNFPCGNNESARLHVHNEWTCYRGEYL